MLPDSLYREALRTSRGFAASARLKSRRQQSDTAEYNEFGEPISVGFLANRSGVHSIGSLPGLENSQPFAINSRGIIVGRAYNNAEDPSRPFDNRAFVWDHGVMRDIGTLGGAIAAAFGVNDPVARSVARGLRLTNRTRSFTRMDSCTISARSEEASAKAGASTSKGRLSGALNWPTGSNMRSCTSTASCAIWAPWAAHSAAQNSSTTAETFVGGSETVGGNFHGFLYTDGMMHDLGTLGGSYSFAFNINDRSEIVGESDTADGDTHAFVVRGGVMIDLDSQVIH